MTVIDQQTGEVRDEPLGLVPLNLAELDENELINRFASPVQVQGALHIARERLANAPAALDRLAEELKRAKRHYLAAHTLAYTRMRRDEHLNITDAKTFALAETPVIEAQEDVDTAELRLQYGRELRKTLSEDVEILRSLNANARAEHRSGS